MRVPSAVILLLAAGLALGTAAHALGWEDDPQPNVLGDSALDLTFTPVVPCRIIDTRAGGGALGAGSSRDFHVTGTDGFEAQGGHAGGCGIPAGATAAVVNFVATNPAGAGNLRAWPFGQTEPTSSIINYRVGVNIANGVVVALCDPAAITCDFDLTVRANVSAADLVADVMGYFKLPANFIGTPGSQVFELQLNDERVMRIEPSAASGTYVGANVVLGSEGNSVTAGVQGAMVAGGGTVGPPAPNQVTGHFGTVSGGAYSRAGDLDGDAATGVFCTVGGGWQNVASGNAATIAGGYANSASGVTATVTGGNFNSASGLRATVAGGNFNSAAADFSFAAGNRAKANHQGAFVWGDSTDADFASTAANQFLIRAGGGVAINTNTPAAGSALTVNGSVDITASGTPGSVGVRGVSTGGLAVYGLTFGGVAVVGEALGAGYAGFFVGNVDVTGTLTKGSGSFKIDHPLDPRNKYLYHSFVESPDMKNIYDGVVTTDADGFATVELPRWFEALNRDFRYQLTVIDDGDDWVMAKVVREVAQNRFALRTSRGNVKVSWLLTGIRKDAFAEAHRIPVEQEKPQNERDRCLHAEACGERN